MTSALFDDPEGVLRLRRSDCSIVKLRPLGRGMKIAAAFSLGPLWQFSSHKSVFFCCLLIENLAQTGQLAATGNGTVGSNPTHPLRHDLFISEAFLAVFISSIQIGMQGQRLLFTMGRSGLH